MKRFILFSMIVVPVFFLSVNEQKLVEQEHVAIDPYKYLDDANRMIKEGDIVVRMNRDPMSHYIRNFNLVDKRYSHAGIVLFREGKAYVFHIINGPENNGEMIRFDPLSEFCSPRINTAWGIYRYDLSTSEVNRINLLMNEWVQKKIVFDRRFDLETENAMYCTEMISKLLSKATRHRISIRTRKLNRIEALGLASYASLPLQHTRKIHMIAIEDLYLQPSCTMIKEYTNQH